MQVTAAAEKMTAVLARIEPLDEEAMAAARERQGRLTKPPGSLGRLEALSVQVAGIRRQAAPSVAAKAIVTMVADHGVVAEGVSAYPQEVTAQMVRNFLAGGAAVSVLARHVGARVVVVDMGVAAEPALGPGLVQCRIGWGTRNLSRGPAMSREQSLAALEAGIDVITGEVDEGLDLVGLGDMGIANTTPSSAIAAAIIGCPARVVTGPGTGVSGDALERKVSAVRRALAVNRPRREDPIDVLAKVGGFEIGGLAGAILAAAANRIPVVLDGFIAGAAALLAVSLEPRARAYLIASHQSAEPGHKLVLEYLGLRPLLNLELRLGEGTGAALGLSLVEAAVKLLSEMATFESAGVSRPL